MKLFRIVHGKGDSGSERAFWMQNPALINGWCKLARHALKLEEKAHKPEDDSDAMDCTTC